MTDEQFDALLEELRRINSTPEALADLVVVKHSPEEGTGSGWLVRGAQIKKPDPWVKIMKTLKQNNPSGRRRTIVILDAD